VEVRLIGGPIRVSARFIFGVNTWVRPYGTPHYPWSAPRKLDHSLREDFAKMKNLARRKFSMKRSRFTDQQIAFALQQAEQGTAVGEVTRKMGISEQTFYRWKKKFGGLMPSEVRKLRQLEEENARLRRLVADLSLDKEMLQEVIRKKL
jgi:putative transposase